MPDVGFKQVMLAAIIPAMLLASWSDLRRHRVPNRLNAAIAIGGLCAQAAFMGWPGLVDGLAGMAVGFGLLAVLWAMHGMGAGDVKFMAALGTWLGPGQTFYAVLAGGLIGGVMAVAMIVYRRSWRQAAANLGLLCAKVSTIETAFGEFGSAKSLGRSSGVMPYAIPLSAGTALVILLGHSGWWGVL